jgi:serine/threonine protein kinase/tetratricopeptide (TPR) repeat protein
MQEDGLQESGHGARSPPGDVAAEDLQDFEDSFLVEVTRAEVPPRLPLPGERMGGAEGLRFEILEELGAGGMGSVFRAWDLELQRVVALKFLLLGEGSSEPRFSWLRREAQAVARLDHENIVRLFDVAEWRGAVWEPRVPFLVMEYLQGESLASLLKRERLTLRRTLALMGALSAGLAHAHARHITHRDLKPANVFLTQSGGVKLLDFGLAHLMAVSASRIPQLPTAGTPQYMAPEQWRGDAQDERADIWAAGILLYELLTGEPPCAAASREELRAWALSPEPVPALRTHGPELPLELEQLVAGMLAKAPEQRLRSAVELRERLRQLEENLGPWHAPPKLLMPQRRQVTLVSCRLSGLAHLAERLDPEDSGEIQSTFHQRSAEIIRRHGGAVVLSVGDEVLACFGYPTAREDDSERAVRAALQLSSQTLPPGELPALAREGLAVQVGIHTDSAVFDTLPVEQQGRMPTLQGAAPRVATWLAGQARPGEAVLSGTTWTLVQGTFDGEALGAQSFEGQPGGPQLDLYRVLREREATCRFERALALRELTPLVGRERELERLRGLWEQAVRGEGALVLLCGEAGIGKSRLIQELSEQLSRETSHLLRFQCWSPYHPSASHPAVGLLQRFFQIEPADASAQGLEALLEEAGLSPESVRELAGSFTRPTVGGPASVLELLSQQEEYKRQVLTLIRQMLLRMAEARPVLLTIEDLHWADPSTLELLGFLLGHIGRARILVLLSARPGFQPPWSSHPGFYRLAIERLPPESTAALIRRIAHGRNLLEDQVQQLVARTDGIPLFVEELTRMMLGWASAESPPAIPVTLHELLLARLDALPLRQKALVQLCAVVGRSFSQELLAQLCAQEEASLRRDLLGLLSAELLQQEETAQGTGYQFRHALIQEAAYQSLPRGPRRQHHRRIAQALVERFPDVVEARPEMLAHHFTEAGEPEPAIRYRQRAAEHALLRLGYSEAVTHLQQALKLLRSLPETAQRRGEELQLLNALGALLIDSRGPGAPDVERLYTRALELFLQVDEPRYVSPLWMGLSSYFLIRGKLQELHNLAARLLDLGQRWQDPVALMQGYWSMADFFLQRGESARALAYFSQARQVQEGKASDDQAFQQTFVQSVWVEVQVGCLMNIIIAHSVRGELEQVRQCTKEALETIRKLERPPTTAYALTFMAVGCQLRREVQRTLQWADEARALSPAVSFRPLRAAAQALSGWSLYKLGQTREGQQELFSGLAVLRELGLTGYLPFFLSMLGEVYLEQGQVQPGLAAVAEGLRLVQEADLRLCEPELYRVRGELLRQAGQERAAVRDLLRARLVARRQQAALLELRATVSLCRQLRDLGFPEAARRRLEQSCGRFDPKLELMDLREAQDLLALVRAHP